MSFTEPSGDRSSGSNGAVCATCGMPEPDATYLDELVHNTNRCMPGGKVEVVDLDDFMSLAAAYDEDGFDFEGGHNW